MQKPTDVFSLLNYWFIIVERVGFYTNEILRAPSLLSVCECMGSKCCLPLFSAAFFSSEKKRIQINSLWFFDMCSIGVCCEVFSVWFCLYIGSLSFCIFFVVSLLLFSISLGRTLSPRRRRRRSACVCRARWLAGQLTIVSYLFSLCAIAIVNIRVLHMRALSAHNTPIATNHATQRNANLVNANTPAVREKNVCFINRRWFLAETHSVFLSFFILHSFSRRFTCEFVTERQRKRPTLNFFATTFLTLSVKYYIYAQAHTHTYA